jgi:hypothetical protein
MTSCGSSGNHSRSQPKRMASPQALSPQLCQTGPTNQQGVSPRPAKPLTGASLFSIQKGNQTKPKHHNCRNPGATHEC